MAVLTAGFWVNSQADLVSLSVASVICWVFVCSDSVFVTAHWSCSWAVLYWVSCKISGSLQWVRLLSLHQLLVCGFLQEQCLGQSWWSAVSLGNAILAAHQLDFARNVLSDGLCIGLYTPAVGATAAH